MPSQMSRGTVVTFAGCKISMLKGQTSCHATPAVPCIASDLHGPLTSL